jgi:hypothetical protein
MDAAAAVVAALACRLGRVEADAYQRREAVLAAVPSQPSLDVDRTLDGIVGALERDEETVTGGVDLLAAMLCEGRSELPVVPAQQLRPGVIADEPDQVGRRDDVGEHERLRHSP